MSKYLISAAAVVLGLAGTAGAALATEPAPTTTAAPAATRATAPQTAVTTKQAVAVVVVRTGGGHGGQSVFTLVGAANREEAEVLHLASTPEFQALRPRYAPAHPASGRYTYRIEAGYRDKTKKRVLVVEGTPGTPKVALDVIRMMVDVPAPDLSHLPVQFPPGFPFN
ncbi:hypothetical protein ACWT_6233 [Actinoplanes sp. SE50]|uniref:hypothetical protein n=1 Tax=unclassified Actinoplanes TaxID=2626549 RepID=UPI00023ED115|nr:MULTISPECIES: hypothetical protein [unclassified Actinoplanes]AEV87248.1 hypothetical protein ACPL_6366 [Actinoplanes sp. SE50/110]ATO85648.1 hypothetical protein ACWT_6233 [Actinoplanes sp. SE50]SLM03061.1 uncharacterized protein ACSP50_6350 [Actinoplanes sp. SE50/110]